MISSVHPSVILMIGALFIPLLWGRVKQVYVLTLPVVAFVSLLYTPEGHHWVVAFLDYDITIFRVDRLSKVFGYIFLIFCFAAALYGIHVKDKGRNTGKLFQAGGALGVVFAGDLITLFFFWEVIALTSVYIIWLGGTEKSRAAGFRYIVFHLIGGLFLHAGIVLYIHNTGSIGFNHIGVGSPATYLMLIGIGINAAFPFFHAWLPDAYPESSPAGTVFLSAFTTKTAIYVLARGFAGADILIWIGVAMVVFPLFLAAIENNLNRVLCYGLINQLGFMVIGVGIGTELAINGVASHAFAHILYKGLLFMSIGSVVHQTGKVNATDLGGLYKSMPFTTICCIIGAASMSFPLTVGFISKSMIVSAAGYGHLTVVSFALFFAAAGVFHIVGIKLPFFAFFSHDSGLRPKDPPANMRFAMGILAFLCIFIGVYPELLYSILPYPVHYVPYTAAHVIGMLQLLFFSALAFTLLMLAGIYPAEIRAINLDIDWFYRKGVRVFYWFVDNIVLAFTSVYEQSVYYVIPRFAIRATRNPLATLKIAGDTVLLYFSSDVRKIEIQERLNREKSIYPGDRIKNWPIGATVIWVTLFLLVFLWVYY
ncbi:MAG: Na(+)/H(+) antiporter subunit D [Thermodesulfobacteriota bacterium]